MATDTKTGASVLLVQDDPMVAMAMELELEAGGIDDTVTFRSGEQARAWLEDGAVSVAMLDWRPGDASCVPLARLLRERGIPFVVHSVASPGSAGSDMGDATWFEKPAATRDIARVLASLAAA